MRKLSVLFIMALHMNTFMFLPQSAETDCYDSNGLQIDDINSIAEYIEVALGNDKKADDEDDDNGNNFVPVRTFNYISDLTQFQILQDTHFTSQTTRNNFPSVNDNTSLDGYFETVTPPPDYSI
ncbi:MAG: hypothetical protein J0H29_11855 [Sphingobacteriales bacterium]|nr:hypothetical protein [Sphingobacteriales bacterium]